MFSVITTCCFIPAELCLNATVHRCISPKCVHPCPSMATIYSSLNVYFQHDVPMFFNAPL